MSTLELFKRGGKQSIYRGLPWNISGCRLACVDMLPHVCSRFYIFRWTTVSAFNQVFKSSHHWPVNSRQLIRLTQLSLILLQFTSNLDRILGDCFVGNGANEIVTKIGDNDQRWTISFNQTVQCFTDRLIQSKGYQIVGSTWSFPSNCLQWNLIECTLWWKHFTMTFLCIVENTQRILSWLAPGIINIVIVTGLANVIVFYFDGDI